MCAIGPFHLQNALINFFFYYLNPWGISCWRHPWGTLDRVFLLEANVRFNDLQSCTSGQCMRKKRGKRNEGKFAHSGPSNEW